MKSKALSAAMVRLVTGLALTPLVVTALFMSHCSPVRVLTSSGAGRVAIGDLSVSVPSGWSTLQSGSLTYILDVPADLQPTLGDQFVFTPQVAVSTEHRLDSSDALKQLDELAAGVGPSVVRLTLAGHSAIQWQTSAPWPDVSRHAPPAGSALIINTAVAAGNQLIRLYGSLPANAPAALADQIVAIETSISFPSGSRDPGGAHSSTVLERGHGALQPVIQGLRDGGQAILSAFWLSPGIAMADDDDELELPPPIGEGVPSASEPGEPGVATRIIQGVAQSEPEVAVSADGRNVVVAQQFVWTFSNNGGLTFTFGGTFPNSTGGDSSLAVGASGNFYEATIFNNTTAIHRSTNGGQTFAVRGTAFTCGAGQCNFTGGTFPDQEHIAADRVNQVNNQDQVYNVFRNGGANPTWGITCSTDGGATWSAGNVGIVGDFPRVTVGQDGFVYVAFEDTSNNLRINKFASCNTNSALPALVGWPVTVAAGVAELPCPIPGLDRCNNGNTLRSPTVVVDDTNPAHVFYAYARNTAAGNENILIQDSTNGGAMWSAATTLNGGGTARRYMPWTCATRGVAYVTWYDRRAATGVNSDLTDFFGASASRSGANLNAGGEFQLNDPGTADAQCLAGQAAGSQASWPSGSRAQTDSTSCSASEQPQLAGVCGTAPCGQPGNTCPAGQTCDLTGGVLGRGTGICRNGPQQFCDFNTVVCANASDSCQLWGGGVPKYGDYNGNACAQGHLYAAWASATPARATNPGIDLFFTVHDTVTPIAACKAVTVPTDPGRCTASGVSIDNGSTDPDNDTFTLSQSPPNPYNLGTTNVTLTITDQNGQSNSCQANVTVIDTTPPVVQSIVASPSTLWPPNHKLVPISVAVTATDVCDLAPKCTIVSVTSNEPVQGPGSGNTRPDWIITDPGPKASPATLGVQLRAERAGGGSGRIYTIGVSCSDASGNSTLGSATVTVAHDQGQ